MSISTVQENSIVIGNKKIIMDFEFSKHTLHFLKNI